MDIKSGLLAEFDQEIKHTRKTLERVPDGRFDFKPHEKSMTLGALASHLADVPHWGYVTLAESSHDIAPDGKFVPPPPAGTQAELLEKFDKQTALMREALLKTDDEQLMQPWSLLMGGKAFFTLPRTVVLRNHVMNHMIHHRAQLGVYLRMNDVAVPAIYGPSADERNM